MLRYKLSLIAATLLIASSGCRAKPELMSVAEAMTAVPPPIYEAKSPFRGQVIDAFYRDTKTSEGIFITYFVVKDSEGEQVRVVKLTRCTACAPIGSPKQITGESVSIAEPFNQEADICNVLPSDNRAEFFTGEEYITCLYWMDNQGYQYMLYSVWSLEETMRFLEDLTLAE